MKYRWFSVIAQLTMLYMILRLIAELLYSVLCGLIGIDYNPEIMQVLKFISLAASIALIVAVVTQEWGEAKKLSEKTGYNLHDVAYALFKMHMRPESIEKSFDLASRVADHKNMGGS